MTKTNTPRARGELCFCLGIGLSHYAVTSPCRASVKLEARGVHFTDKKEEAYFTATLRLPRVGEVSATYIADRYLARVWEGGDPQGEKWTEWRIIRQDEIAGVGPKTRDTVRDMVEPVITEWLASEAYGPARQKAIASFVIRTLSDSRWGIASAKRTFEQFRSELSYADHTRIAQAIDHLEAAEALLETKD